MEPVLPLKKQLRRDIRAIRLKLSAAEQQEKSKYLTEKILKLPEFYASKHIAAYWPVNGEINPLDLFQEAHTKGIKCYLPFMIHPSKHLEFIEYQPEDELTQNEAGIWEPKWDAKLKIPASNLDLVLLPIVAFDEQGNRLGMGGGYYDRTFAFLKSPARPKKPFLLALGYELQCVNIVPTNDWDISVNGIMTEARFIRIF